MDGWCACVCVQPLPSSTPTHPEALLIGLEAMVDRCLERQRWHVVVELQLCKLALRVGPKRASVRDRLRARASPSASRQCGLHRCRCTNHKQNMALHGCACTAATFPPGTPEPRLT
eukprot:365943-Chlamydomonas_euryale.AAC.2